MTLSVAVAVTIALQVALVVVIATRRGVRRGRPAGSTSEFAEYRAPSDEEMPAVSERRALFGGSAGAGSDTSRR